MKRLITDTPELNLSEYRHKMTYICDGEVYIRDCYSGKETKVVDYCNEQCREICDANFDPSHSNCGNCLILWFYHLACGHAELRERLLQYENQQFGSQPKEAKR